MASQCNGRVQFFLLSFFINMEIHTILKVNKSYVHSKYVFFAFVIRNLIVEDMKSICNTVLATRYIK